MQAGRQVGGALEGQVCFGGVVVGGGPRWCWR